MQSILSEKHFLKLILDAQAIRFLGEREIHLDKLLLFKSKLQWHQIYSHQTCKMLIQSFLF